jgi:hypothetical protein
VAHHASSAAYRYRDILGGEHVGDLSRHHIDHRLPRSVASGYRTGDVDDSIQVA